LITLHFLSHFSRKAGLSPQSENTIPECRRGIAPSPDSASSVETTPCRTLLQPWRLADPFAEDGFISDAQW
jgi:hypothetical protein